MGIYYFQAKENTWDIAHNYDITFVIYIGFGRNGSKLVNQSRNTMLDFPLFTAVPSADDYL